MASRPFKIPRSVLLIRRADAGEHWQSVTGSVDHVDEPLAAAAAREVLEETGIDAAAGVLADWGLDNVYDIYPHYRHRYAPEVSRNSERVFGLTVPAGTPVTLNPREHTAYQWLPWRAAADACFSPSNAEAILLLPQFTDGRAARCDLQHPQGRAGLRPVAPPRDP